MAAFEMVEDSIVFILVAAPILTYILYWLAYGRFSSTTNLSGPQITLFLGNFPDLRRNKFQLHLVLEEYFQKYGNIFGFNYQGEETKVIADEEIIKQIFGKQFKKFHNRKVTLFEIKVNNPCGGEAFDYTKPEIYAQKSLLLNDYSMLF